MSDWQHQETVFLLNLMENEAFDIYLAATDRLFGNYCYMNEGGL